MLYLQPTAQRTFHWTRHVSIVTTTIKNSCENHRERVKWTGEADILQEKCEKISFVEQAYISQPKS